MLQKIREAIELFAANIKLFSLIVLTVWLPGSIVLAYSILYVIPQTSGGNELRAIAQEIRISNLIEFAFGPLYIGALLHAAARWKQGLPTNYRESMNHGARRSFKLWTTRIGTGLIILGGIVALVIPGIYFALRFALIDAVVVLEGIEGKRAQQLSTRMTLGQRWSILGAVILTFLGLLVISNIISFVLFLPLSFSGQEDNAVVLAIDFITLVIDECLASVLFSFFSILLFMFYWDAKAQEPTA